MNLQSFVKITNNKCNKNLHYFEVYNKILADLPICPTILEIGVNSGESLRLWHEYLPQAKVVGIDINPCKSEAIEKEKFYQGDQADKDFLKMVSAKEGPFDLVIDDASHNRNETLISLKTLFEYTKKYYVIEDWACYTECPSIFSENYKPHHNQIHLLNLSKNLIDELCIWRGSSRKFGDSVFEKIEYYENILVITKKT